MKKSELKKMIREILDEDLRNWFKSKWVNIGKKDKDGKHPPCGTSGDKRGYAKCVPQKTANKMPTKKKKVQLVGNGLHKIKQIEVEKIQQVKERNLLMSALTQRKVVKKVEQEKDHERRMEQRLQKKYRL